MSVGVDPIAQIAEDIIDLIDRLDEPKLKADGRSLQRALERALAEANKACRDRRLRAEAAPLASSMQD